MPGTKHLAVSGSRHPLTLPQRVAADRLMKEAVLEEGFTHLHMGDCVGGDLYLTQVWAQYKTATSSVIVHPPSGFTLRANWPHYLSIRPPMPYLRRNQMMVHDSEALIAAPGQMTESVRSGTWSTIRYARQKGIPILIILPNGHIRYEAKNEVTHTHSPYR